MAQQHTIGTNGKMSKFIGLGSFRPRNNGYFGRFKAEMISWG
jgi:hypothetical protein